MPHLAHVQIYDADGVHPLPSVHASRNVEYAYALALDVCRIRTRALSRLNIQFFVNLIHRGMKALERATYLPEGSSEWVRKEVRTLGLRIGADMSKWVRNTRTRDAIRLMARTAHNCICIDAEVKSNGGGCESFHLFDSLDLVSRQPAHAVQDIFAKEMRWVPAALPAAETNADGNSGALEGRMMEPRSISL